MFECIQINSKWSEFPEQKGAGTLSGLGFKSGTGGEEESGIAEHPPGVLAPPTGAAEVSVLHHVPYLRWDIAAHELFFTGLCWWLLMQNNKRPDDFYYVTC